MDFLVCGNFFVLSGILGDFGISLGSIPSFLYPFTTGWPGQMASVPAASGGSFGGETTLFEFTLSSHHRRFACASVLCPDAFAMPLEFALVMGLRIENQESNAHAIQVSSSSVFKDHPP